MLEEGRCSQGNLVRFLRKWRCESLRVGADVTVGMGKMLQERAGIAPIELIDRDELLCSPTDAARRARLAAEQAAQAERAREIMEWDVFKRASLGGAATYCLHVDEEGRYVDVANAAFQRLMGGAGWPGRHMQAYKMLACYMGASLCAPDDREVFLQVRTERERDGSECYAFAPYTVVRPGSPPNQHTHSRPSPTTAWGTRPGRGGKPTCSRPSLATAVVRGACVWP